MLQNPDAVNSALEWVNTKTGANLQILPNAIISLGIGGSGKSFSSKFNLGDGTNTWQSGGTDSAATNLHETIGGGAIKTFDELMKLILNG